MLYQAYQLQSDLMSPLRLLAQGSSAALWLGKTEGSLLRKFSASMEVFSRLRLTHSRPAYGITSVKRRRTRLRRHGRSRTHHALRHPAALQKRKR
jgi:poly-beta-hydroxyalkanoate depolymerase